MTTRFQIEGLGDVGPIVVPKMTELDMALGGGPSPGFITIRDEGLTPVDFIAGKRITVDRGSGSDPIWSGYLLRPARRFWFDVDKPDTMQRQWRLSVVDINWLFSKRVVFKVADPETIKGPLYNTDTYDDDVIDELVTNWLDLSADDIDVTTRVSRVGHINAGQQAYPFNASMLWRDAMANIAQLPAAIWGLDAQRRLVYADVDDENAPFVLSDLPGPGNAGYREMQLWYDGQRLVNDALCWGFGIGGANGVFERLESSTSIAAHGLWQDAVTSYSIWKQSTIDKVADSIINGSPESKRGAKNDRVWVKCVTYEDGLALGDRVRVVSDIWGFEDVMPVRKVKLLFPTPDDVRYELEISHEIDRWGFEDPQPPLPGYLVPPVDINIPIIEIPGIPEEECGITDTFERNVVDWGTSDVGIPWTMGGSPSAGAFSTKSVDGSSGVLETTGPPAGQNDRSAYGTLVLPTAMNPVVEVMFRTNLNQTDIVDQAFVAFLGLAATGPTRSAEVHVKHERHVGPSWATYLEFSTNLPIQIEEVACPIAINAGIWYHLKFRTTSGGSLEAKVWEDGDPEPSLWVASSITHTFTGFTSFTMGHLIGSTPSTAAPDLTTEFNDLDIEGVDCHSVPPTSGPYCETILHAGDPNLSLARAFVVGSERVYINGLLQLPTIDYTPDGPAASIVLDSSPPVLADVRVCYQVA